MGPIFCHIISLAITHNFCTDIAKYYGYKHILAFVTQTNGQRGMVISKGAILKDIAIKKSWPADRTYFSVNCISDMF